MNNVLARIAVASALFLFAERVSAVEVLEEIVEQKYTVPSNAVLNVANIDGSIRVYTSEKNEILIQAIKKAYSHERLQGIVVAVDASPNRVAITTTLPPRKNAVSDRSGTVDYILIVPQTVQIERLELVNGEVLIEGLRPGAKATAHLVNGWIAGHNCFSDLDLSVETGRLDVAYDWWENHELAVKATSNRGNIRAIFPNDAALNLSATATDGKIANAFDSKKPSPADVTHSVSQVIGADAQAVVSLETKRGNIRIERMTY
jgi:hypothetical protein